MLSSSGLSCPVDTQTQGDQEHCSINDSIQPQRIQIKGVSSQTNKETKDKYKRGLVDNETPSEAMKTAKLRLGHTPTYSFGVMSNSNRNTTSKREINKHQDSIQPCEGGKNNWD